jgi:hypothetical protein
MIIVFFYFVSWFWIKQKVDIKLHLLFSTHHWTYEYLSGWTDIYLFAVTEARINLPISSSTEKVWSQRQFQNMFSEQWPSFHRLSWRYICKELNIGTKFYYCSHFSVFCVSHMIIFYLLHNDVKNIQLS